VRRLSVASLDSGAESPVYGEDPSAPAGRMDPEARPPRSGAATATPLSAANGEPAKPGVPLSASNEGLVVSAGPVWPPAPPVVSLPEARQASADASAQHAPASQRSGFLFGGIARLRVPQGCPAHDATMAVNQIPGQIGAGAPRLAASHDMSVVDQQSGRWYAEDIRTSTQSMGVR
jgi:hypothetical protein